MIVPIIDDLANEYDGKVKFAKVDVDLNQSVAATYSIKGIPTLLVFNDGDLVDQIVGAVPKGALDSRLDKVAPRSSWGPLTRRILEKQAGECKMSQAKEEGTTWKTGA